MILLSNSRQLANARSFRFFAGIILLVVASVAPLSLLLKFLSTTIAPATSSDKLTQQARIRYEQSTIIKEYSSAQQNTSKANILLPNQPSASGVDAATKCTFCEAEGGNFNKDMLVPGTGGDTCGSIKAMAAGHLNDSDVCATMQKEERVCCLGPPTIISKHQVVQISKSSADDENEKVALKTKSDSHPPILYGHVHVAKTGGTSLNGIMANRFERVCGHKGYSYDAFQDNEQAKRKEKEGKEIHPEGRSRVFPNTMKEIGFEDCDYISQEDNWQFWTNTFGNGTFHGMKMELHVPCRNRLDHLMSQCNYRGKNIACDAKTDEELFKSVKECFVFLLDRYDHALLKHFDVRCFDFKKQFNNYTSYMSGILQKRRFQSTPYVKRDTNRPRNKANECIWENRAVLEKIDKYLLETVPYYQFCNDCMGSENEITATVAEYNKE